ncbi:hypothetical protein [Lysobacter capsici]|uniref:hypothetical protein n=1 Tax=Lysobacter capsici TaxID=435897 RepID=UPI00398D68ED
MASAFASTAPYWVPALSALMVYRRIRRTFGVQPGGRYAAASGSEFWRWSPAC